MALKLKLNKFSVQSIIDTGRVSRIIRAYLRDVKAEIERLMRLPKTGRTYRKPGGGFYRASAPGQAPAIRTGTLLRSVREVFPSWSTGQLSATVDYAEYLEQGTRRMRKRPFFRPALREVNRRFSDVRIRVFNK